MNPGPAAILGNGSLLATLSARGLVERLFWPNLDSGSHLGDLRFGIELEGAVEQSYLHGANVLLTRAGDVELVDFVHELEPVLLRRLTSKRKGGNGRLVVDCRPELDGVKGGLAASVDGNRVVFYRRNVALALGATNAEAFATGLGETEGGISLPFRGDAVVAVAFGASSREAVARLDAALQQDFDALATSRVHYDAARLARAGQPSAPEVVPLYQRSLLVLELLSDRDSGAVIAAPELDPEFERSGGYGFVWGRDLAFVVLGFLAAGRDDLAKRALRWLPRAQEPEGLWLQRHWTDGSLAPSWCRHQLDETGAILFAYEAAWRQFGDETLDADLWPSAFRAAEFLLGTIEEDGIPTATADLWEEREGRHAFTAAAIHGGLRAAASLARRHEPQLVEGYEAAAEVVREAIERELWSDFHGRYLRSIGDPTLDVSLLGLAWPFAAVDPGGERMRATVAALEGELGCPAGSLRRYAGDTYAGGNRWVLAALWLGLWHRQVGDLTGLERSLTYALGAQTKLGLLPEQVTEDGEPAWVVPLAWSHAMLLLAARPELALLQSPTSLASAAWA